MRPSDEFKKKNATLTGICRLSHCAGESSKSRKAQVPLGHAAEVVAARALRLEKEEASPAGAHERPRAQVDQMLVLAGNGLGAQLAPFLGRRDRTRRALPDALQHREGVVHRTATSVGHSSYTGLRPKEIGTARAPAAAPAALLLTLLDDDARDLGRLLVDGHLDGSLQRAAEDGQPSQLPSRRSLTAPNSSSMAKRSTSPPCWARNGRTEASASWTRTSRGSGCSPCTSSRLATSSSAAKAASAPRRLVPNDLEHALDPRPVELGDEAQHLLGQVERARSRVCSSSRRACSMRSPLCRTLRFSGMCSCVQNA